MAISNGVDGSVSLSVDLSMDDAERELDRLKKKILSLEESIRMASFRKSDLTKSAAEIGARLDEAKAKLYQMQNASKNAFSKNAIKEQQNIVKTLQGEYDKVENEIDKCNKSIRDGNIELGYTKERYGEVAQEVQGTSSSLGETVFSSTAPVFDKIRSGLVNSIRSAIGIIGGILKRVPGFFKSAFSGGLTFVKSVAKGVATLTKKMNIFSGLANKLGGTFKRLGSLIKQAFVFNVISAGFRMMRQEFGDYLSANTELMNALGRLKGVLLTAFQPIYDAILPALTRLVELLTRAAAAAAQFIASIFGKTAKQAQSSAKALHSQAKALDETGESAEEAAVSLAGFDEINVIQTEDTKKASSANDSVEEAGSPIFDYEYGEKAPFDSWGEAFSAFLDYLLNTGIPKLREAFSAFAGWLNNFSQKLYDMFTFPGVKEKVILLGQELAMALNDLVNQIDWNLLGKALGAGLNLALLFLVNLIYTFDWINLGASLASFINGLVSQIDFYALGQLLWSGFKMALETLAGFLMNLDMVQLGQAATKLVHGFFDSIMETLDKIDWSKVGKQIETLFLNIDWKGLAKSAEQLVKKFFNSVTELISSVDWHEVGRRVKEALVNVDWAGICKSIAEAFGAAFGAAAAFLWELLHEAWQKIVNWWRETAFKDGKFTMEGLLNGIRDVWRNIYSWLKTNVIDPFVSAFKRLFGISSPSTVMQGFGDMIAQGLLNGVNGIFGKLSDWASNVWDNITGLWNKVTSWVSNKTSSLSSGIGNFSGGNSRSNLTYSVVSAPYTLAGIPIPKLATGAVIPPNREFMAVLGDQENGMNIETPENLLRKIMREESGGYGDILRQILQAIKDGHIIMVDETTFGMTAIRSVNAANRRAGKQLLKI